MSEAEKYQLLTDEDSNTELRQPSKSPKSTDVLRSQLLEVAFSILLLVSTALNVYLVLRHPLTRTKGESQNSDTTRWAHLARNVPKPINFSTQYGPAIGTVEERDRLWNALDISPGAVLLSDEFARNNGLPLSQRFPWDQSKGVYLLGAFHQMHCLKQIYQWSSAIHQNKTPDKPYSHVSHCLDTLLQDVYCHADDTPWYQLPPEPYRQNYAKFQTRQCRSWEKLMQWSEDHDACYQYENVTKSHAGDEQMTQLEHYQFCREGNPYIPIMEAYFEDHSRSNIEE